MSLLQSPAMTGGEMSSLLNALIALRQGRTGARLPTDWEGVAGKVADAFNEVVEQNERMAEELDRLRRVVGKEGKLSQRLSLGNAHGFWRDSVTSVNDLIDDLIHPTIETARVIGAVAQGDLSKTMSLQIDERPLEGEFLRSARTINKMVDQLSIFASEVTRVAREVGTEGILGGQAKVKGVAGTWKDLTDSVNGMAGNLTAQVRNVAEVTTAVAAGDLSRKITVDVKGEFLELKNTINTMVDQLRSFASEVTRVAREVGTEGILGGQARVEGVSGTWKDLTDSVNGMAGNLTTQVRNIATVTTAVANGDLSRKITVDVKGEILELKITVNTMVDQLSSFASEVTRVAREVGTEGRLGGQADVRGVAGVWKDLTDNVNSMASNLTVQLRDVSKVATAIAMGDLTQKITVDVSGEILQIKDVINTMVDQLRSFASEVTRVAREVGTEGMLGGQADVIGVAGTWKDLTDSVNFMAGNLTGQVRNIAEVTTAVAVGDLSRKITVDVKGEILELKNTVNTMVDQLRSFASEVTRVAREVGTEGSLGGQARVEGVSGTWKDLTDSVNGMAANLTAQVRGIAKVVTAVANGDLKQKLRVQAEGEIAELAETINEMIDTLATFADQVTTVAREVGVEGQLGGQAKVPGAAGIWKALTENVNQLAANLTNQVRAIADVATAVTEGDLTRSITVEAQGEVAALSSTINEMIRKLRDTTQKNTEQDWLKTNLAKFSRLLQGQRDLTNVGRMVLSELCPVVSAQQAEFYVLDDDRESPKLTLLAGYASDEGDGVIKQVRLGQGLVGQCAMDKQKILLDQLPPDYIRVSSGLGSSAPRTILVLPLVFEGQVRGVLELASLGGFNPTHQAFLEQLTESIGIVLNTIEANMRTEDLLKQSTALAHELQTRQEELEKTNAELQEKSQSLVKQNQEVERKNREVEQARQALEEKAEQLALTNKYKSEFLANMSHELRTPLNSLLILSDQLCKNSDGNLSPRQLEFAKTIHSSGNELLMLINDILDLSKIESGTANVELGELRLNDLEGYIERTFRHVAESKNLDFQTRFDPLLPITIYTDIKRLQQIIKNLLSNAFKFTHHGQVTFEVEPVVSGWDTENEELNRAQQVLAFSVSDTGIGIPAEKQQLIFEAFQQADGSTSRKYGGTGLGLAISRELSRLLGGEIRLLSTPMRGSTFVLYLPAEFTPRPRRKPAPGASSTPASIQPPPAALPAVGRIAQATNEYLAEAVHMNEYGDDRAGIAVGDQVVLIVENDTGFARFLLDAARGKGFKGVLTSLGAAGLVLGREYNPSAIILDIHLPDMDGWKVLERLKQNPATRHIPVVVISTDDARELSLESGAIAFLAKPIQSKDVLDQLLDAIGQFVNRPRRRLLVVGNDPSLQEKLSASLAGTVVEIDFMPDPDTAVRELADHPVDCVVVTASTIHSFADALLRNDRLSGPVEMRVLVVVHGGEASVGGNGTGSWHSLERACSVRRAPSVESVLELVCSHIHLPESKLPKALRNRWLNRDSIELSLAGKKILIVDDDMRNIFALASILEEHDAVVVSADNGRDAIDLLRADPDIEIVLMDIMMPEMDGMETIRAIRKIPSLQKLPIVAVTAKAMKGDRERCIEAGAWDYLSKPVDSDQLLAVLLLWLNR